MKRIKRIVLIIGFMFLCFIPFKVNAANLTISASSNKVKPGTTVTFTIKMNGVGSFGASQFIIKYDNSKFSYVSDNALQGSAVNAVSNGQINVSLTNPAGMSDGNIYQVVLKSNQQATSGTSQVTVTAVDCWDPTGVTALSLTGGSLIITHYQPSNINTLKNLSVSGCTLSPSFNSETTSYKCAETESSSVTIDASATDGSASISGNGKKNLNFGSNKLNIVVTSESGVKKTYTVSISRKDTRSNENGLESLTVSGTDFVFDPNETDFTINVDTGITNVTIDAKAKDEKCKLSGPGTYDLQEGENLFYIQVAAENGISKIYTLNIIRKPKDNVPSTNIVKLIVNEMNINISGKTIAIGILNDVEKLNISLETTSKTSTYKIEGNDSLTSGINIVNIIVSDEGVEDTIYKLIVNKDSGNINIINNLNELKDLNQNVVYKHNNGSLLIPKNILNVIKNSSNALIVNGLNEYNGLLYELTIDSSIDAQDDLELLLNKIGNNPLAFSSTIPAGVKINIFIENTDVKYLYSFDLNTNTYKLISDNLVIKDNYLEFTSNGGGIYILSDKIINITKEKEKLGFKEWFTRIQYLLIGIVLGAIGMFFLKDKFVKNKKTITPTIERL